MYIGINWVGLVEDVSWRDSRWVEWTESSVSHRTLLYNWNLIYYDNYQIIK